MCWAQKGPETATSGDSALHMRKQTYPEFTRLVGGRAPPTPSFLTFDQKLHSFKVSHHVSKKVLVSSYLFRPLHHCGTWQSRYPCCKTPFSLLVSWLCFLMFPSKQSLSFQSLVLIHLTLLITQHPPPQVIIHASVAQDFSFMC